MIILTDLDDVLDNLLETWVKRLNEKYNLTVNPDDITDFNIYKFYPDLIPEQIYAPLHESNFASRLHPKPGAQRVVKQLLKDGHRIVVVTASHYTTIENKIDLFLRPYFPDISDNCVIMTPLKHLIIGDVMIDDSYDALSVSAPWRHKLLFDAPHNRGKDETKIGAVRVKNWDEIYTVINNIEKEKE